jgi:hypothetical protein
VNGLGPQVQRLLTKVSGNELGECPDSESDDDEENPSQGLYMNHLVSGDPWTTHVDVSEATVSTDDDDYIDYMEHNLADGGVECHHGLQWRRYGVLEEPLNNMPKMYGRIKPEYVKNFGTPLDSIMFVVCIYLDLLEDNLS